MNESCEGVSICYCFYVWMSLDFLVENLFFYFVFVVFSIGEEFGKIFVE